ncbi:MAG: hypothetical protein ACOYL6_16700 [Bacteriovoracaceae bacterium]
MKSVLLWLSVMSSFSAIAGHEKIVCKTKNHFIFPAKTKIVIDLKYNDMVVKRCKPAARHNDHGEYPYEIEAYCPGVYGISDDEQGDYSWNLTKSDQVQDIYEANAGESRYRVARINRFGSNVFDAIFTASYGTGSVISVTCRKR